MYRPPTFLSDWKNDYYKKLLSVDDAAKLIKSGTHIFSAGWAGDPDALINAISARSSELEDVVFCSNNSLRLAFNEPHNDGHIRNNQWFVGPGARKDIQDGNGTYTVHNLSKMERDMAGLPIDYGIMMVSPPDKYGFMSFGVMVCYARYLVENARTVIVQVNENMPYVRGDSLVHISEVDHVCEDHSPIATIPLIPVNERSKAIAEFINPYIEDGSTIQLGIGAIPNSVGKLLAEKHDLGVHSEMITEGVMELIESGAVNNSRKTMHKYKSIGTFAGGSERLYKWLDNNPFVEFYPAHYVNDPYIISRQPKLVSINATLSVDLAGQACSESIGPRQYSGVGGQMDFNLGAGLCPGGQAFMVLNSTANTKEGVISTIVPTFPRGTFVTTNRNDIDHVVTEYGVAKLRGKSLRERTNALISIAHPDFRAELKAEALKMNFI
ncbi:MAG: acetyl-CoA hydrolase/transferase family protein [Syntrophomonadaceae bacterium]|nr:acetyl-CoA hydrolase/transferase family protein [Syntrophomonadaceae bacterium]